MATKYDFDEIIDRTGTNSMKWDRLAESFPEYDVSGALPMWIADMDFKAPREVIDAIREKAAEGIYGYQSPKGHGFDQAVINWLEHRHGWTIRPEWILTTPGVVAAISFAVQEFTDEGDGVLIQTPVYYPFKKRCIQFNHRVCVENPLIEENGYYTIDFEDFEEKARRQDVKLFILCNPHNPVGRVWREEELKRLLDICRENNVIVVSDEIHSDLIMQGYKHVASGSIATDNLIACYAASKTFNLAGMKTSVIVIPDERIRARYQNRVKQNEAGGLNFFGETALRAAFENGETYVEEVTKYIGNNLNYAYRRIEERMSDVHASITEGTYFLWLDFRSTGLSTEEIDRKILEEAKVAGDLGKWFGAEGEGFLRLNLACPRATVEEALNRLEKVFG